MLCLVIQKALFISTFNTKIRPKTRDDFPGYALAEQDMIMIYKNQCRCMYSCIYQEKSKRNQLRYIQVNTKYSIKTEENDCPYLGYIKRALGI